MSLLREIICCTRDLPEELVKMMLVALVERLIMHRKSYFTERFGDVLGILRIDVYTNDKDLLEPTLYEVNSHDLMAIPRVRIGNYTDVVEMMLRKFADTRLRIELYNPNWWLYN